MFSELFNIPTKLKEKNLYENLIWLSDNQQQIEKDLQKFHDSSDEKQLFLYDVTSSYLEGTENELAKYGYNRDKKKSKKQIVIGLLTNKDGTPVATRVFEGNTSDCKTIEDQINILKDEFSINHLTLVGDRAMFSGSTIETLPEGLSYITAIRKKQIETFIKNKVFDMSLFDNNIQEVAHDGIRYILRCNPIRKAEIRTQREEKLATIKQKVGTKNKYLAAHSRAKVEVATKQLKESLDKLGVSEYAKLLCVGRAITLEINNKQLEERGKLDGCYCIKTNLTQEEAAKEIVHDRYKDLAYVEYAFRTMKQSHLEIRPLYLRRADRTKGHVLVVMLSYIVQKELAKYWKDTNGSVQENLNRLMTMTAIDLQINDIILKKLIKPNEKCKTLLKLANVSLPKHLGEYTH